jgi:Bacterial low temperature requirement A protein (LtrA)
MTFGEGECGMRLGPLVIGLGRGWRLAPEHFAERYGLIMLIALGESIIAIGIGAGPRPARPRPDEHFRGGG